MHKWKGSLVVSIRHKKSHSYVYGQLFTLVTDHQPLTSILGPKTGVPPLAAARMQRWNLLLSAYQYNIEFCPTKAHSNADGLSRLSLPQEETSEMSDESVFNVAQIETLPVSASKLRKATQNDPILGRVQCWTSRE